MNKEEPQMPFWISATVVFAAGIVFWCLMNASLIALEKAQMEAIDYLSIAAFASFLSRAVYESRKK